MAKKHPKNEWDNPLNSPKFGEGRRSLSVHSSERGGKLTTAGRRRLGKSEFALPAKGKQKRRGIKGRYPIPDKAHARNALARVSQFGSPAEKAEVRAKVHRKYPGIGKKRHGKKA